MANNAKNRRLGAGYNRSGSTSYGSGSTSVANYGNSAMSRGTFMKGLGLAAGGVAAAGLGLSGTARAINWGPGPNGEPTYVDDPNNPRYPQVCAFMYHGKWDSGQYWGWYPGFSGILIGQKTILTCAHAVDSVAWGSDRYRVSFDVYPTAVHNPTWWFECHPDPVDCECPEYLPFFGGDLYSFAVYFYYPEEFRGLEVDNQGNPIGGCLWAIAGDGDRPVPYNWYDDHGNTISYREAYDQNYIKLPDPDEDYYKIVSSSIHPGYQALKTGGSAIPEQKYDIAIIELDRPVGKIVDGRWIPVPPEPLPELTNNIPFLDYEIAKGNIDRSANQFSVAGYGTNLTGFPIKAFQMGTLNTDYARKYAQDRASFNAMHNTRVSLSANFAKDQTHVNLGDSGGPNFYRRNTDSLITLVGITSRCDSAGFATEEFERLDVPDTLDWIKGKFFDIEKITYQDYWACINSGGHWVKDANGKWICQY